MEAAGQGAYEYLEQVYHRLKKSSVLVICGKGNNAGDGFVVARYLHKEWIDCRVVTISSLKELSPDAIVMAEKLEQAGIKIISEIDLKELDQYINEADLIIDALLGTGINKEVRSPYREWIDKVNASRKPVFALDIPSGICADTGKVLGCAIEAYWTATFASMKLGLALSPGCTCAGEVSVIDIGIPPQVRKQVRTAYRLVEEESVRSSFRLRNKDTHKGTYGHVLIIAGSTTKLGAALMTAKSCLRSGSGLATLVLPDMAFSRFPEQFLELMYEPVASASDGTFAYSALRKIKTLWEGKNIIAIGPGIGVSEDTQRLIRGLLKSSPLPIVIDADGINSLEGQLSSLSNAKSPVVITPHPGEMATLLGISTKEIQNDRLKYTRNFSREHNATVVLKGFRTVTAFPDGKVYINPTGNPAMATAGMGDVLTGIIAGLLAQGLSWVDAVCSAVYIHGLAGDRLADRMGDRGLLAGDVIDSLPFIMKEFVPARRPKLKSIKS
jgi:NAD(P)H-hydrate epimerase